MNTYDSVITWFWLFNYTEFHISAWESLWNTGPCLFSTTFLHFHISAYNISMTMTHLGIFFLEFYFCLQYFVSAYDMSWQGYLLVCSESLCNVSTYNIYTNTYDRNNSVLTVLCRFLPESSSGQMMRISIKPRKCLCKLMRLNLMNTAHKYCVTEHSDDCPTYLC